MTTNPQTQTGEPVMCQKIWRVNLGDANYQGIRSSYLIQGESAADVEDKAIRLAKRQDDELEVGEARHNPYVTSIDLIGELELI